VAQTVCCGNSDEELTRRAMAAGMPLETLRNQQMGGTPAEILDKLAAFAEAGAQRVYLQVLDMTDLDHVRLLGSSVLRMLP
jgi:hypothetical protein